jgi:hypothetical protein
VTPTTITFPIEAGNDDCVKIRFKMRRIIPVQVIKFDANHFGLEDWNIQAVPGAGNLFASPEDEDTDAEGFAFFTLTPGSWIFMERPPKPDKDEPRESYMPVVPPTGRQEIFLDEDNIGPTETITVVFKNELAVGCVSVLKYMFIPPPTGPVSPPITSTVTAGGVLARDTNGVAANLTSFFDFWPIAGWTFTLERKDGSIARQGVTDATGRIEFDNLPFGPYTIVEENRSGWDEFDPGFRKLDFFVDDNYCDDIVSGVPLDPGFTEAVVFVNEQDDSGFCVEGYKVDANGGYGIPDWKIEIEPKDEGGFDPDDVFTDGLGKYRIEFPRNDYRVPGAEYEICEDEVDGWLAHTDTCQTVVLPEWPMGECIQLKDFVNQQVGHSESEKGKDGPKGDGPYGGPKDGPKDGPKGGPGMGDNAMRCSSTYEVKDGEGLFDIGKKFKVSPQAMLDANPDVRKDEHQWLYVGQRICIP